MFPLKVRAKCLSMTTATNWLLNFAIAYATPYLVNSGPGYANMGSRVFFIWGSCCFICIFFVWFLIYETEGLSLEQVDELYGIVGKAWKSKEFRPAVTFLEVERSGSEAGEGGRRESLQEYAARKGSAGVHSEKV